MWAFGYWLNETRKFTVEIQPTEEAPTAAEHRAYSDSGDLFAWQKNGPRRRFEVKGLTITFSGRRDWPFREVFVSSVRSVHRSVGDVYAWVSISADLKAAVMIMEETTWETWYRVTKLNSVTGNDETYYACPLDKVSFISLIRLDES